jgi:hypothetical protein
MLNIIDEFTRECLAIRVNRKIRSTDVIDVFSDLFILRGIPGHIRSDNGLEFVDELLNGEIFYNSRSPMDCLARCRRSCLQRAAIHSRTALARCKRPG